MQTGTLRVLQKNSGSQRYCVCNSNIMTLMQPNIYALKVLASCANEVGKEKEEKNTT